MRVYIENAESGRAGWPNAISSSVIRAFTPFLLAKLDDFVIKSSTFAWNSNYQRNLSLVNALLNIPRDFLKLNRQESGRL